MKAYTIGAAKSYDQALVEAATTGVPVKKIGKGCPAEPDYPGGWVWKGKDSAIEFATETTAQQGHLFVAYEIELPGDWDDCTYLGDEVHHLLVDATIVARA